MKVTSMFMNNRGGSIKAFAKVETEEGFVMDGFRVCEGRNGFFVGWPTKEVMKDGNKEYFPVITTNEEGEEKPFRIEVSDMVLAHYMNEQNSKGIPSSKPKAGGWGQRGQQTRKAPKYANSADTAAPANEVQMQSDDNWA